MKSISKRIVAVPTPQQWWAFSLDAAAAGAVNLLSLVYKGGCLLSELLLGNTTTLPNFSTWYLLSAALACLLSHTNLLAPSSTVYTCIALRQSVVLHFFTADEDLAVSLLNLAENSL